MAELWKIFLGKYQNHKKIMSQNCTCFSNSVEVVEAEVLRLSLKELMFIGSTRHDVRDVKTVSHANDTNERSHGQNHEQTYHNCLQTHITSQVYNILTTVRFVIGILFLNPACITHIIQILFRVRV